jgi:hypothetical protein
VEIEISKLKIIYCDWINVHELYNRTFKTKNGPVVTKKSKDESKCIQEGSPDV